MKYQKTILAVLGAVVIICGLYFFSARETKHSLLSSENSAISLYVLRGDVSYRLPGESSFQKATTSPIALTNKAEVYTGIGEATVLFPNNSSVDIDEYTELTITYENSNVSLYQTLGKTYHRVETLLTGAKYEVRTPSTLAAVRGTAFAVSYDKRTNESKVAVTESKVEVSLVVEGEIKQDKTTVVGEGKVVRVDPTKDLQATSSIQGAFFVDDIAKDAEINTWLEEKKTREEKIQEIRKEENSVEIRKEIQKLLLNERAEGEVKTSNEGTTSEIKREETPAKETPKEEPRKNTSTEPVKKEPTRTETAPVVAVKKINEETFFDTFNTLFIDNFYIDDKDSTCTLNVTPEQRVRVVTKYGTESGYPFSAKTLGDFATAIDLYCKNKDPATKVKLQARFDVEFPFKEDI